MSKSIHNIYLKIFFSISFILLNSFTLKAIEKDSISVINISEINYKIEKAKRVISKIKFVEQDKYEIIKIDSTLTNQEKFLEKQSKEFYSFNANNLSKVFLANTFRIWNEYSNNLKEINEKNNIRFNKTDDDSRELSSLGIEFSKLKENIKGQDSFDIISERVDELLVKIEDKKKEHYEFLKKTIEVEDKLSVLIISVDDILNYTQHLLNQKKKNTFKFTDPPLWNTTLNDGKYPDFYSRISKAWYENQKLVVNQVELIKDEIPLFIFYSILLYLFIVFLRKIYTQLGFSIEDENFVRIERIIVKEHILVSIAMIIALLLIMFPSTPILLSNFLATILLLLFTFIFNRSISNNDIKLIFNFFIIVTLYNFEIIAWYFSGYARFYFLIEIGVAIFLLSTYYLKFLRNTKDGTVISKISRKYLPYIIYAYIVSAIAQIIGLLNLSILLNKILAIIPLLTIIVFMAFKLLDIIFITISEIIKVKFPISNEVLGNNKNRILTLNKILLLFIWVRLIGNAFQLDRSISQFISDFFEYTLTVKEYSITVGSLVTLSIVVFVTYYLSSITSKFFSNEKVKNTRKTPRGLFAATSLSLRMVLVLFGGTLAMAEIGLDLSKFTIIAGALGVGIGFGLQDIVNNFISGLILIYGRPIQVGDTVEVDSLLGRVKSIGIRSSTLVTYDGAEVLVPNSLLISNKLTNWTLSDNKKRMEIYIGVEYGSNLEEVIEILELAASKVEAIIPNPEPKALFMEFGNSSLDFRLRYWVPYEDGLSSKSDTSVIIYKLLEEKGITIPFPQLDVHHFNNAEDNSIDKADNNI